MFTDIIKRYILNIIKMYQWSHLIKKKIKWERNNFIKRKKKSKAQSQAN
jgi:hypothetical protein